MKKLIFLFVLMWLSFNAAKGVDPSCLFNVEADGTGFIGNKFLDSTDIGYIVTTTVLVDTCGLIDINGFPFYLDSSFQIYDETATEEKRFYTNEMFKFNFPYFPFDTTGYNIDTVTYFTANDIKQELSTIKDSLLSLSSITGEIRFYETDRKFRRFSYTSNYSYGFCVSFENMVNAYETEEIINNFNIDKFKCQFISTFVYPVGSVYEKNKNLNLYPNPASNAVFMDIKENIKTLKITN